MIWTRDTPRQRREEPVVSSLENMLAYFHCFTWHCLSASHRGQQTTASAAFLKDDEKRDWLVEPHWFTFGLTFMIAPMRNAALGLAPIPDVLVHVTLLALLLREP